MSADATRVSPEWLALREPADAAARAVELLEPLQRALPRNARQVIHDLGCGTGSMARWLAPLLPGPQHWVALDRDPELLAIASTERPGPAADGAAVTVQTAQTDIADLQPSDLAGATLITASALLDLLTETDVSRLAGVCAGVRCPILLTLSVAGRVEITPAHPLDRTIAAAFDSHQRRTSGRGRLLGPDAVDFAVEEFRRMGTKTMVRPSPWRLGPAHAALITEWFTGWVGAACEQRVELDAESYTHERLAQLAAGQLAVTVHHADLLVLA